MKYIRPLIIPTAVLVSFLLCFAGALLWERSTIQKAVQNYISIWEDEIATALVEKQDPQLFEKIVSQLRLISDSVSDTRISLLSDSIPFQKSYSLTRFQTPIAVNYLTIGLVEVNLNVQKLIFKTLLSPLFLVVLFILFAAASILRFRDLQAKNRQQALAQDHRIQSEIAQMARQVAHDIRGPLTALKIIAGKQDSLSEHYRDVFQQGTERIHQVAEELLMLSKGSCDAADKLATQNLKRKSGLQNSKSDNDIEAAICLSNLLAKLKSEVSLKDPKITWNFNADLGSKETVNLALSESRLTRILFNVLQNSAEAKATEVTVQALVRKNEVVFLIQDNGIGISDEILPKLFKNEISYGKPNGNGLGLKSAKEFIESAGGRVHLASKVAQGTLVQFRMPLL